MRNSLDFSSWQSMLSTVLGLLLATLLMLGIRLVFMQTMQRRRERENRQINERLKALIAAYKTLGSSFTGELSVDPTHLKQLRATLDETGDDAPDWDTLKTQTERRRRMRDAVEAALSDVILLGTEEHVALAARAAQDMVEGRAVQTAALVVSLRNFIRQALDLQPIPDAVAIPEQGPVRVTTAGANAGKRVSNVNGAGAAVGGKGAGGGAGGGMGMAGGMALGAAASVSTPSTTTTDSSLLAADLLPPDNPRI